MSESINNAQFPPDTIVDARGLRCPLPLLRAKLAITQLRAGEVLCVLATDSGALRDIPAWAGMAGHELLAQDQLDGAYRFFLRKAGESGLTG